MPFLRHIKLNNICEAWFAYALLFTGLLCSDAFADCTTVGITNAITTNFIACVDGSIRTATYVILNSVSNYMALVVASVSVYAIAVHGIKILGGETDITAKTAILMLRLAVINFFFYNLGGLANIPYAILDEVANITAGGWTPWGQVDAYLGAIFGFDASDNHNRELFHGVLAMLGASLFAGTPGIMAVSSGLLALFKLILFALDLVYVYLLAVLVLSLCIIISPLMIPLALFQYSERYFNKWLSSVIGSILVPAFLFGFLSLTLNLFEAQIGNILSDLNPNGYIDAYGLNSYSPYARQKQTSYSWVQRTDPNVARAMSNTISANSSMPPPSTPVTNTTMDPKSSNGAMVGLLSYWGVNFGNNNDSNMVRVLLSFVSLWIYASVLIGMIKKIPGVAYEIAGATAAISIQGKPFASRMAETKENIKIGGGSLLGGTAGGQVGAAATRSLAGREASGVAGAIVGGLIGKRL